MGAQVDRLVNPKQKTCWYKETTTRQPRAQKEIQKTKITSAERRQQTADW